MFFFVYLCNSSQNYSIALEMQIKKVITLIILALFSYSSSAQSVGLVLSGGGAKGFSHIGVIRALEENNIPIDYIAGTSMGAIIAALYSVGVTPDEMMAMFRSKDFESWYKGEFEKGYATYIYRRETSAEMVGVSVKREQDRPVIKLPVSLIAPYPMDLAVMQLFASSSAASGYDFDNLMIPFRCIAADIANKKPYTLRKGDLGSAVRASMTYPFLFKPIIIDSILMFDGGFYNNFPWDVMVEDFDPDFIIGSKCSNNSLHPDSEDIISQIENMLMVETDYSIPEDLGILIDVKFQDVAIMDFQKLDQIAEVGYNTAQKYIKAIKEKVPRIVTPKELSEKRMGFRINTLPLRFRDIEFVGDGLDQKEEEFIRRTIKNNRTGISDHEQIKRGFYRVVATGLVNTMYPQAVINPDSTFNLHLRVTKQAPVQLSIGGNISSSSLNQGYIGVQYKQFAANPWRINGDFNLGRYYSGLNIGYRQDVGINPLWFYEANFTVHRFDYFGGSQTEFFANRIPSNIQESEVFTTISAGTPVNIEKNMLAKFSLYIGKNFYEYYQDDNFTTYDTPDRTRFSYISPTARILRNTTNYKQYPTEGIVQELSARYTHFRENHIPGSTSLSRTEESNNSHNTISVKAYFKQYFNLANFLTLGVSADLTLSNRTYLGDYTSTLLYMPAFQPSPHSKTLLLSQYKAPSYLGVSLSPIIKISNSLFVHFQASYFQPHKKLEQTPEGLPQFGKRFPLGSFMGNFAFVWQSPVGPISLSTAYYDKEEVKWYPQFNIGFQIYKPKALAN